MELESLKDPERLKSMKKRAKKVRQRMNARYGIQKNNKRKSETTALQTQSEKLRRESDDACELRFA